MQLPSRWGGGGGGASEEDVGRRNLPKNVSVVFSQLYFGPPYQEFLDLPLFRIELMPERENLLIRY